jgi:hypothetical protein
LNFDKAGSASTLPQQEKSNSVDTSGAEYTYRHFLRRGKLTLTATRLLRRARVAGCHAEGQARAAGKGTAEEGAEVAALFRLRLRREALGVGLRGPHRGAGEWRHA